MEAMRAEVFDLLVVGGGIFGACIGWKVASCGLSVVLLEKGDFGGSTSAKSFRVVHGGIRFLQHADLSRIRESVRKHNASLLTRTSSEFVLLTCEDCTPILGHQIESVVTPPSPAVGEYV